jgi:hypothetical protein
MRARVGCLAGAVGEAERSVRVAQQRERQFVLVLPGRVRRRVVDRDPEHRDPALFELRERVAQPAALRGAACVAAFG